MTKLAPVRVEICNRRGLHARAAASFVKLAATFDADINVTHNDQGVNGHSIMGLMMLAASPGCFIEISAQGKAAEPAVKALIQLVSAGFHED